jgi:small conductance mechanosensitive channel
MTQGYSSINIDVPVTYDTDLERAKRAITEVCEQLAEERERDFVSVPRVERVQAMLENYLLLRVSGDVRPGLQWELSGELRLRIKQRFDHEGITMTPAGRWRPEPVEPEAEAGDEERAP